MAIDPVCGMKVNESTNLKLKIGSETYYFCSKHCMDKFAKENAAVPAEVENEPCESCTVPSTKWYKNRLFIVTGVLVLLCILSYFVKILEPFRISLLMYFKTIWIAVTAGLVLGGIIDYFIPREYISKLLASPKKSTIFLSVLLGFLMTACSHGILALSMALYKKGASTSAVVSFLLASPWANIPLTLMLVSFFGLKAFYIIFGAMLIAVNTGLIFQFLEKKNLVERNGNMLSVAADFSITADIRKRRASYKLSPAQLKEDVKGIFYGTIAMSDMVLWWIFLGMGLASLAGAYIPTHLFHKYMGPTVIGLLVTLLLATVIEVCSEGTAPLAFEIYRQTNALGNSFVFLLAGVVTDYTEIGLIWVNIGRRAAIWMPIIAVPQTIILGILANLIFK